MSSRFNVLLFLLIATIVILVLLLLMYNNFIRYRNKFSIPTVDINKKYNQANKKVCVLLTMYIGDEPERREFYTKSVRKWLQHPEIEIFIVDSSGQYILDKEEAKMYSNLHQYSFKQQGGRKKINPSVNEKESILNILNSNFDSINDYDFIYKLTGKYYIENFKSICIDCLPLDADYVLQHNTFTNGQNTELIGFRPSIVREELLDKITKFKNFESSAFKLRLSYPHRKIYRLPLIEIDNNIKRSDGIITICNL